MENLTVFSHEFRTFPEVNNFGLNELVPLFCWETNLENLYLSNKDSVYELNVKSKAVSPIFSLKNTLKDTSPSSYIVGLAYLSSLESLCIAVSSGELFTVEQHFSGSYQEQLVASAVSIKLMEWSPSHDTVAVLTNEQQLLVMSADFDLVAELNIQTTKASEELVSVGWGKEETQFKGSAGKKTKTDSSAEDQKLVDVSTSDPVISWRGDGQLFSVNFVKLENQSRCVSVFNRNGELLYSNVNIPGMENSLAWRPIGNFIAVTQRLPNKHQVCFVEKNTLKHSTFDLPFAVNEIRIKQLCWSADSKILLLWCIPQSGENVPAQFLNGCCESFLLYSSYNYHWYLKQRLDFTEQNRPLSAIWDAMSDCRMHLFSVGGRYDCFDFDWVVNDTQGLTTKDGAYVGLIDNACLKLTCFRFSVIPPPMCTVSIPFSSTPRFVMFAATGEPERWVGHSRVPGPPARGSESFGVNPNDICVILSNGSAATLTYQSVDKFDVAVHKFKWECEGEQRIQDLHHWTWADPKSLFCCGSVEGGTNAYYVAVPDTEDKDFVFKYRRMIDTQVVAVASIGDGRCVVQTKDGEVFTVEDTLSPFERHPDVCRQLVIWRTHLFGLSKRGRLYINGHLAGDNVTSLAFHSRFFLITTSRHRLLLCYFSGSPLKGMITEGELDSGVVSYGRRVERGSKLVHAISEDTRVILSLPRGNLECIQPRTLTLDIVIRSLEKCEYRESFELARKHRIDLNILCDEDPESFVKNVDAFVKQVNNPDWLCLFLSELRDEDVTATLYEPYFKQPRTAVENKVFRVCSALRKSMRKLSDKGKFNLPIISSYVHTRTQTGLERALGVIKELKKYETDCNRVSSSAFKHILYLTDVDQLIETALGMYDFDLVVLVASKSDKDPKEYLAFLNELKKMDPTYQRFSIDKHLQRWQSALKHLISTGPAYKDELVDFVKEHNLYNEALKRITQGDERFEGILKAYAEYLWNKRLFAEAGTIYRRFGDHRGALHSHTKALLWRESIIDICNVDCSEDEKRKEFIQLALTMSNAKEQRTAGMIYEYYVNDPETAASFYINGHAWQEAITALWKSGKTSLLDDFSPKVEEHKEYLVSVIISLDETLRLREQRLRVVRSKKLVKWNKAQKSSHKAIQEDRDSFSDTSSVSGSSVSSTGNTTGTGSGSTGSTGSTGSGRSKNRRKHERKILSLKEDNPYEEGALVYAIHKIITSAFELREDVKETCHALIHFNKLDSARTLQEELASLLTKIEEKLSVIWPPRQSSNSEGAPNPYEEMSALEPIYQFAPATPICAWESALLKKDEVK